MLKKEKYGFEDLKEIMRILRSENGCPWDREQTHKSIRNNFLEEAYEAIEAIDDEDPDLLKEELGDVLLQVVFHAQMSSEEGAFDLDGVCDGICTKLIVRHPHIFAGTIAATSEQVLSNWENIKIGEKGYADAGEYVRGTAKSLPALMRAQKIHKRLLRRKMIRELDLDGLLENIKKDIGELEDPNPERIGRILYDITALANRCDIDSEQALYNFIIRMLKTI